MYYQDLVGAETQEFVLNGTNAVDMSINEITDPNGAAAPNFVSLVRGGFTFSTVEFAGTGSTKEFRSYRVELAHNTDPSKGYEVHHRATPTDNGTGDVKMFIEYCLQKKAGNAIAGTTKSAIKTILTNGNTNGTEYYFSFHITIADTGLATMEKGDSLLINICRLASDAADTFTGGMAFIEFGVHGFSDSTGEAFGD